MSCNADNKKPEPPKEESGGFFSWIFGGGSSAPAEDSNMCSGGCGMEKCNCNCALREHLKECCGFGTLPPLITKDTCPVPKRATADKAIAPEDECKFPPVETDCQAIVADKGPAAFACSSKKDKGKCELPETDVSTCIPAWVCPPTKSNVRAYPAPVGVVILPISSKPRGQGNQGKPFSSKCGSCGTVSTEVSAEPKVANKNCPMVRSRTCEPKGAAEGKDDGSIFAKIGALFSGKAAEFEEICQKITAAAEAEAEEENCNCKDCVKERKQEMAAKKVTSVKENFQKCSQNMNNPYTFQNPSETFCDFKAPPGTEMKRAQPKGCNIPPPPENCAACCECNENTVPAEDNAEEIDIVYEENVEEYECPPIELEDPCAPIEEIPECAPIEEIPECAPIEEIPECAPVEFIDPCDSIVEAPIEECVEDTPMSQYDEEPSGDSTCEVPEDEICCCCEEGEDVIEESPETCSQELSPSGDSGPAPQTPGGKCNESNDSCVCDDNVIEETIVETVRIDPCPEIKSTCVVEKVEAEVIVLAQEEQKKVDPCAVLNSTEKIDPCAALNSTEKIDPCAALNSTEKINPCAPSNSKEKIDPCAVLNSTEKIDPCAASESDMKGIPPVIETPQTCAPAIVQEAKMAEECPPSTPQPKMADACLPIAPKGPGALIISGIEVQKPNKDLLDATCNCKTCVQARAPPVPEGYDSSKSPCGRCGENRGENDSCPMCRFANNVRNSCPPKPDEVVVEETDEEPCDCEKCFDPCESSIFHEDSVGKPIYEGGMCMTRVGHFMWKINKGAPSFKDLAYDGTKFKGYGVPGEGDDEEMEMECTCEEHMKMMEEMKKKSRYVGGMEMPDTQSYMWARAEPK